MITNGENERTRSIFNSETAVRAGIITGTVTTMLIIYNLVMTPIWSLNISFTSLQKEVTYLKENHLRHMEADIGNIRSDIKDINTRMDKQYDVSTDNNRLLRVLTGGK
jgi:hypothetical protein